VHAGTVHDAQHHSVHDRTVLNHCREKSTKLVEALAAVASQDIAQLLLAKALKEGQITVLKTKIAQGAASVTAQVRS
jgi:dihydroneopterin aldolase